MSTVIRASPVCAHSQAVALTIIYSSYGKIDSRSSGAITVSSNC